MHTGKFVKRFWENKFSRTELSPQALPIKGSEAGSLKEGSNAVGMESPPGDNQDMQIFPLTLSGQIGCFTCHDPHSGAKGAKLRVESKETLCTLCHPNRSGIIEKYLKNNPKPKKESPEQQKQKTEQQLQGTDQQKQENGQYPQAATQQKSGTGRQPQASELKQPQKQENGQHPQAATQQKQKTGQQPQASGQQKQDTGKLKRKQGTGQQKRGSTNAR
jgi:predicted CXXCH cytochrome family protein